jgi:RNA polymerase sigma-70 factor (ECF subfamily)
MDQDSQILELCHRGRQEGFARLLLTYQERVYRRAYSLVRNREDALDITQEVFLRTIRAIRTLTPGRPLWPWLRRVTTNLCLNHIRDRHPHASLDDGSVMPAVAGGVDPEEAALAAWHAQELQQALERLPPLYRMVVVLRHEEGLSYEEIAQAMSLPVGTVKTWLFRARRMLRAALVTEG